MIRQRADRKRKQQEEHEAKQKAEEMKQKQLEELRKRQKETKPLPIKPRNDLYDKHDDRHTVKL